MSARTDDKPCDEFKLIHEEVTATEVGSRMVHGRSDVSDIRGFTSYLENWGVTRLPTLVLFRNGRAQQYPHKGASFQLPTVEQIETWLLQMAGAETKWPSRENEDLMFTGEDLHDGEAIRRARADVATAAAQAEQYMTGKQSAADASATSEPAPRLSGDEVARRLALSSTGQGKKNLLEVEESAESASIDARASATVPDEAAVAAAEDEEDLEEDVPEDACDGLLRLPALTDGSFEQVVLKDKSTAVLVLFYRPSRTFCAVNGTVFVEFEQMASDLQVRAICNRPGSCVVGDARARVAQVMRMDVAEHLSPFQFDPAELPVIMLFPALDKKPLEFSGALSVEALANFSREHSGSHFEPKTEL